MTLPLGMRRLLFAAAAAALWFGAASALAAPPPQREPPPERPAHIDLEVACAHDDLDKARQALDRGAPLETSHGRTAPLCVAARSKALHVAALLLERGAPVQGPCSLEPQLWSTPLHEAVGSGRAMVKLLLDHGARPERTANGFTPMTRADRETTLLLRSRGAALGDRWLLFLAPNLLVGADVGLNKDGGAHALVGLRPEIVLKRPYGSLGTGIYLEASSRWWHDAMLGGGLVLVPSTWIVPSVGAYARHATPSGWDWGVTAGVFLGSHASNRAEPPDPRGDPSVPPRLVPITAENAGVRLDLRWGTTPADRSIAIVLQLDLDLLYLGPLRVLGAIACCR